MALIVFNCHLKLIMVFVRQRFYFAFCFRNFSITIITTLEKYVCPGYWPPAHIDTSPPVQGMGFSIIPPLPMSRSPPVSDLVENVCRQTFTRPTIRFSIISCFSRLKWSGLNSWSDIFHHFYLFPELTSSFFCLRFRFLRSISRILS